MKFGVWSNQIVPSKKVENNIFLSAALYGANIYQIFFTRFVIEKYLESFFTARFNWSSKIFSHPSDYLLELQLILVDLLA